MTRTVGAIHSVATVRIARFGFMKMNTRQFMMRVERGWFKRVASLGRHFSEDLVVCCT